MNLAFGQKLGLASDFMSVEQREYASGEPAWEIAYLFPPQGQWSESEYLSLNTSRLVELSDGKLEVLPVPSELHQLILLFMYRSLLSFVEPSKLGVVLVAPLRVRLWEGKFREPDIVFMASANSDRRSNKYWDRADLVMEIVSEDDPDRDLVDKRRDYARARIPEYWIVDPRDRTITVLAFDQTTGEYVIAGQSASGDPARSVLLAGFAVAVKDVFEQPNNLPDALDK